MSTGIAECQPLSAGIADGQPLSTGIACGWPLSAVRGTEMAAALSSQQRVQPSCGWRVQPLVFLHAGCALPDAGIAHPPAVVYGACARCLCTCDAISVTDIMHGAPRARPPVQRRGSQCVPFLSPTRTRIHNCACSYTMPSLAYAMTSTSICGTWYLHTRSLVPACTMPCTHARAALHRHILSSLAACNVCGAIPPQLELKRRIFFNVC